MHTRENMNTAILYADRRDRSIKSPSVSPALDSLQVLWTNLTKYGLIAQSLRAGAKNSNHPDPLTGGENVSDIL